MNFTEIDSCFGSNKRDIGYEKLKSAYEKGDHSPEVLWRLAQFCHEKSTISPKAKRIAYIYEGIKYAEEGMKTDPTHFKSKIEMGNKFKSLLDKAITMQPNDYVLLHLRARYKFTVASLTWLERKLASTFYATVPTHTFEEALEDFLACYKIEPKWIENFYYIAKTYVGLKDKENARKYLKIALEIQPQSDVEIDYIADCKALSHKL
ncbi:unnamed protein product [Caenorhabditis angaria]|uniref:Tetratricopeptide repeat protein n=1 Tax=Caenorhabditis angaria TaxID=860376 RepID=A0A9P1IP68_9PELO|nr:unnamed protein product [Caenorhabditis angaria]